MQKDTFVSVQYNKATGKFKIDFVPEAVDTKNFSIDLIDSVENNDIVINTFFVNPDKKKVSKPIIKLYKKPEIIVNPPAPIPFTPKFGLLYNFYAVSDSRNICSSGWDLFTHQELLDWSSSLPDSGYIYIHIAEKSLTYWDYTDDFMLNDLLMNVRGSGFAYPDTNPFIDLLHTFYMWTKTAYNEFSSYHFGIQPANQRTYTGESPPEQMMSIRPCRPAPGIPTGTLGSYVGNDLKQYATVVVNGYEILSCNLAETKFRNGDLITKASILNPISINPVAFCSAYNYDDSLI